MAGSRPKYSLGTKAGGSVKSLVVTLLGGSALATFAAHTLKVALPERAKLIGVMVNVGLRGGTHSTSTLDVKNGSTSLLGTAFDVAALTPATPVHKEIASLASGAAEVAQNTEISIVTAESGGTSPTWADVTVQIDYVALGD